MYLQDITLKNYKSISSLRITRLGPLNCFIGPHNSGKSNILDGLSIFWNPKLGYFDEQKKLNKKTKFSKTDLDWLLLDHDRSQIINGNFHIKLINLLSSWKKNNHIRDTFTSVAQQYSINEPDSLLDNFLDEINNLTDMDRVSRFKFDLHLDKEMPFFNRATITLILQNGERVIFEQPRLDNSIIQQAIGMAFFTRFYDQPTETEKICYKIKKLIENEEMEKISRIQNFLEDIIEQEFSFSIIGDELIVTIEKSFSSPIWRISRATKRIIALAYLLNTLPTNMIIIFDEPELHLHPKGERRLARQLEEVSNDHQLFFSTHSARFLIGHAYLVTLSKGWKTHIKTIQGEKAIRKVVKLMGIRPSDSLGSDVVVFCEGTTDAVSFRAFEDILTSGKLTKPRITYIPVGGWTKMKFVLSIELLKSKFVRSRAIAVVDGDITITQPEVYQRIRKNWLRVFPENTFFQLDDECLESIFLNQPNVLKRVFNNTFRSERELRSLINRKRKKGLKDKEIIVFLVETFLHKHYNSVIAEKIARSFTAEELPSYLKDIFNNAIMQQY